MTRQKEYIITEERVQTWLELDFSAKDIAKEARERPYDPEAVKAEERERILDLTNELFPRSSGNFNNSGYLVGRKEILRRINSLRGDPCSVTTPRLKGAKCKNKSECNQYKREGITKNCIGCGSLIRSCEP